MQLKGGREDVLHIFNCTMLILERENHQHYYPLDDNYTSDSQDQSQGIRLRLRQGHKPALKMIIICIRSTRGWKLLIPSPPLPEVEWMETQNLIKI